MPHNAGKKLVEAISKQLERIEYFSSAENVSPNLAVHEMRKTFKRLRSLVRFYFDYPVEFPSEYSTQIKYFGRSLSAMRESFVNIQVYEKVTAGNNMIPERKIKVTRERLASKNRQLIEMGFLAVEGYLPIQKFTEQMGAQIENFEIGQPSIQQIVSQLEVSYQLAFDNYIHIGISTDAESLHELRKIMKRLMYQFDFIRFSHPRFFKLKTFQLNTITEQLGEDHDLYVFLVEMKSGNYELNSDDIMILENQNKHLRELNLLKLAPRLKQFFNEPPEFFNQKLEKIFKVS